MKRKKSLLIGLVILGILSLGIFLSNGVDVMLDDSKAIETGRVVLEK